MAAKDERELRQADLSHLRLQDMTPGQRAELRRRYAYFVRQCRTAGGTAAASRPARAAKGRLPKWVPGAKG